MYSPSASRRPPPTSPFNDPSGAGFGREEAAASRPGTTSTTSRLRLQRRTPIDAQRQPIPNSPVLQVVTVTEVSPANLSLALPAPTAKRITVQIMYRRSLADAGSDLSHQLDSFTQTLEAPMTYLNLPCPHRKSVTRPARMPRAAAAPPPSGDGFLTLFGTLSVAYDLHVDTQRQSAGNLATSTVARSVAEAGLRWQSYRLKTMSRSRTLSGTIDQTVAAALWPAIKTSIATDYATMSIAGRATPPTDSVPPSYARHRLDSGRTQTFQVTIAQDPVDARNLIVTSVGTYGRATRKVQISSRVDKKIKFAMSAKVPSRSAATPSSKATSRWPFGSSPWRCDWN